VSPALLNDIISTVIGVAIMTVFDLLFASSPAGQARQRLLRAFSQARDILESAKPSADKDNADMLQNLMHDLDALLEIMPYAADEPALCGRLPFKSDLYRTLEKHLRAVGCHLATLRWASKLNDSWVGAAWMATPPGSSAEESGRQGPSSLTSVQGHFAQLLQEVDARLAEIQTLCVSVVMQVEDEEEAARIRRQLQQTLYTPMIVRSILTGPASFFTDSRSITGVVSQSPGSPSCDVKSNVPDSPQVPASPTSLPSTPHRQASLSSRQRFAGDSGAQRITNERFFSDDLELLPRSSRRRTCAVSIDDAIENFRSAANKYCQQQQHEGMIGELLDPCRVEAMTYSFKFVFTEIQHMQLALLEY